MEDCSVSHGVETEVWGNAWLVLMPVWGKGLLRVEIVVQKRMDVRYWQQRIKLKTLCSSDLSFLNHYLFLAEVRDISLTRTKKVRCQDYSMRQHPFEILLLKKILKLTIKESVFGKSPMRLVSIILALKGLYLEDHFKI